MTTAIFKHIDVTSSTSATPWTKVDGPGSSFQLRDHLRPVHNLRTYATITSSDLAPSSDLAAVFNTDTAGFSVHHSPSPYSSSPSAAADEGAFATDAAIRAAYYPEVEALLRKHLRGAIKKVVVFDHTIRRRHPDAPRQPVQQVHVDQTPAAAAARVRRHLPAEEDVDALLSGRYQIVNVWRPIGIVAEDYPLAVVDWRSTRPEDYVPVDLLYPRRADSPLEAGMDANDDRGKERLPEPGSLDSTEGYEKRGETIAVAASERHQFHYVKDMTPQEVMLLKCFDSRGEGLPGGWKGEAMAAPHTAFVDPDTRPDAPGRESIEVRCLVFYD
ncbi:MAG: hypothetical protein M1821_003642 [Bathelium mastoideum]|nr:MAG: hypothetical protein M1821_003642 [Bathelium mastoideum]